MFNMQLITIKLKKQVGAEYTRICDKHPVHDQDYVMYYRYIYGVLFERLPFMCRSTIGYQTENQLIRSFDSDAINKL